MNTYENRINELDLIRGLCIIGVFISHIFYDLSLFISIHDSPPLLSFLFQYGGILFIVLSGICSTLGNNCFRRGCVVLFFGLLITFATWIFSLWSLDTEDIVRFGILHLIGTCMLLTPLLRKLTPNALPFFSVFFIAAGVLFQYKYVEIPFLFPLGLISEEFSSADYWPIFPNIGYYCIGIWIGVRFYPDKKPLLSSAQGKFPILAWMGRNSLVLYLLQQPVILGLLFLLSTIGII